MNGLIRASLKNPYAVTVMMLTLLVLGTLTLTKIPIDILPIFKSPAVQVLTFYGGMPAVEHRKRHHQSYGAVDRPGGRNGSPGVAFHRRRQHHSQLLPRRHRSERRLDAGEFAGFRGHSQPSAWHLAAGGAAVRPDQYRAGLSGGLG